VTGWRLRLSLIVGGFGLANSAFGAIDAAAAGQTAGTPAASAAPAEPVEPAALSTHRDRVGRIIVPVTINGRGPFRFMVDTGANHTVLAQSVLARLDLPVDPDNLISVVGVSGTAQVASAHVDQLDAGALHFTNMQLPVLSGPVFDGIDGILGMDGFDGKRVMANFVRGDFHIVDSHGWRASFLYTVLHVRFLSQRLLMIECHVGRIPAKAIIDTGGIDTLGNLALYRALARRDDETAHRLETGVIDVNEASQLGIVRRVPELWLGTTGVKNLNVTFGDFSVFHIWDLTNEPALLVGMDVLGTLAELNIDYQRQELQLRTRYSGAHHPFH
jgi:predicted aspartyl protease